MTARQQDKLKASTLEKQLIEERRSKQTFEAQLAAERKSKKSEEAQATKASRNECSNELCRARRRDVDNDLKSSRRELGKCEDRLREAENENRVSIF